MRWIPLGREKWGKEREKKQVVRNTIRKSNLTKTIEEEEEMNEKMNTRKRGESKVVGEE